MTETQLTTNSAAQNAAYLLRSHEQAHTAKNPQEQMRLKLWRQDQERDKAGLLQARGSARCILALSTSFEALIEAKAQSAPWVEASAPEHWALGGESFYFRKLKEKEDLWVGGFFMGKVGVEPAPSGEGLIECRHCINRFKEMGELIYGLDGIITVTIASCKEWLDV